MNKARIFTNRLPRLTSFSPHLTVDNGVKKNEKSLMDDIDASQFLPDGESVTGYRRDVETIVTNRKLPNGETDSGVEYRALASRTILSWLYETSRITAAQWQAACAYQNWREYTASQLEGRSMPITAPYNSVLTFPGVSSLFFVLLLQRLSKREQTLIDWTMEHAATDHMRFLTQRSFPIYLEAFDRLEKHVALLKDAKREAQKISNDEQIIAREIRLRFLGR